VIVAFVVFVEAGVGAGLDQKLRSAGERPMLKELWMVVELGEKRVAMACGEVAVLRGRTLGAAGVGVTVEMAVCEQMSGTAGLPTRPGTTVEDSETRGGI
jgi:hypothetical protein